MATIEMHTNDRALLEMWASDLGKRMDRRNYRIGDLWQAEHWAKWVEWLILIVKVLQK